MAASVKSCLAVIRLSSDAPRQSVANSAATVAGCAAGANCWNCDCVMSKSTLSGFEARQRVYGFSRERQVRLFAFAFVKLKRWLNYFLISQGRCYILLGLIVISCLQLNPNSLPPLSDC